jgi:tetratricopeptide (TPR) repeat protein
MLILVTWRTALATGASLARPNRQFNAAREAESGGRYREAVKLYEEFLRSNPSVAEAYNNLGLDYYRLKEYEEAAVTLHEALRLKPGMLSSELFLGLAEFNLGDFEDSEKILSVVLKSHPSNRPARLFLIRDQMGLGTFDLELSQQTLAIFPDDVEVNYTIGTAALQRMRQLANYAEKLGVKSPVFQRLSKRTDNGGEGMNKTQMRRDELQKEGAAQDPRLIQEYDELAIIVQRCFRTVLGQGAGSAVGYDLQGRIDEARGLVDQALSEYGKSGDHFAAGRLLAENFRLSEAARELEQAVAEHPENRLAVALLAKVYVQEHQPARAIPVLQKLLKDFSQDAYAWNDLGKAQLDLGQTNEAIHSLRVAVRLNPSLYRIHFLLALAYRKLGQTQLEKEEIEKFRAGAANRPMHTAPQSQN